MTKPHADWLTPEELAEQMGMSARWVKDRFASGDLPSVKVGGKRFWTPGCMEELEARHLKGKSESDDWGRVTRARRSA
jgi:hypothetical protein